MSIPKDGRGPTAVEASILDQEGFDPSTSSGLFVGISAFEDSRFAPVPFAVDDAVDLAHLFAVELQLLRPQRAVLALAGEPRKAETAERLARLLESGARRVSGRQSDIYRFLSETSQHSEAGGLFLLTIATHGMSDQGGDFLVATDSFAGRSLRTGVAVDEVLDDVSRAGSPRRLVLLDSCRERLSQETRGQAGATMKQTFADAISRAVGQVVLSGATVGGFAYDDLTRGNGVFTAAVIDGLRGAAPVDERGIITASTLAGFLQSRVETWVRRHRPDHAGRSLGIGQRIEGPAAALPLAIDPEHVLARTRYRNRRTVGLASMRENLGLVLKGMHFDLVENLLPPNDPSSQAERLLEEIAALDGSARSQRSLRDFLRELDAQSSPAATYQINSRSQHKRGPATSAAIPALVSNLLSRTIIAPWLRLIWLRPTWVKVSIAVAVVILGILSSWSLIYGVFSATLQDLTSAELPRIVDGREAVRRGEHKLALQLWRKGCEAGQPMDCAELGEAYRVGLGGIRQNPQEAVQLVMNACDTGDRRGCTYLGLYHLFGLGNLNYDAGKAVQYFRDSCISGDLLGCTYLGKAHQEGWGDLTRDHKKAVVLYRRACDENEPRGCSLLGSMYASGKGGLSTDQGRAIALNRTACEQGSADGCLFLGYEYEFAQRPLALNETEAIHLYRRACEGGSMEGCAELGRAYRHEKGGVETSQTTVVNLLTRACTGGLAIQCGTLGFDYSLGRHGLTKDLAKAVHFFDLACEGGSMLSCSQLGNAFELGLGGLAKDEDRAVDLYLRACDGDEYYACFNAGVAYRHGKGDLTKDEMKATALFRRACGGGIMRACRALG